MRRSLVFTSGDGIGDEEVEKRALGCEAARLIGSRMVVFSQTD